jgi:hypothetical protein
LSRKFITDREVKFINDVNRELIQRVVGQTVHYYAISLERTNVHRLYNEAIKKTWSPPVEIDALVLWDNPSVSTTNLGVDSKYSLDVYFHTLELQDRNVVPREGDFVEYGQVFFEITSVTQPQMVFGQINNRIMTKCTCVPSREGQFQAGNQGSEDVDRSHPVEQSIGVNK